MTFTNRCVAGRQLAARLADYGTIHPIVLGLPRGGVPVAFEVAHALEAPLDVLVARKVSAPNHPELAIGAVALEAVVLNADLIRRLGVQRLYIDQAIQREREEVVHRLHRYRGVSPAVPLEERTAVLVDDGIATGSTVLAAVDSARRRRARRVVVATPVASAEAVATLRTEADDVVCVNVVDDLYAISVHYEDFTQITDDEVRQLLKRARLERETNFHPTKTP